MHYLIRAQPATCAREYVTRVNKRPLPRETLAANLKMLLAKTGWSEAELERRSGVSQKTINNLIHERHPPNLETVDQVAAAFKLNCWHLIMPNLEADIASGGTVSKLVDAYLQSSAEGRAIVLRLAEREAADYKPGNEPTDETPTNARRTR